MKSLLNKKLYLLLVAALSLPLFVRPGNGITHRRRNRAFPIRPQLYYRYCWGVTAPGVMATEKMRRM